MLLFASRGLLGAFGVGCHRPSSGRGVVGFRERQFRRRQFQALARLARELPREVAGVPPLEELEREDARRQEDAQAARQGARERPRIGEEAAPPRRETLVCAGGGADVRGGDAPDARAGEAEERGGEGGAVEEVGEAVGEDEGAVEEVEVRVRVPQEPFVCVPGALAEGCVGREGAVSAGEVVRSGGAQEQGGCDVDVVALI